MDKHSEAEEQFERNEPIEVPLAKDGMELDYPHSKDMLIVLHLEEVAIPVDRIDAVESE